MFRYFIVGEGTCDKPSLSGLERCDPDWSSDTAWICVDNVLDGPRRQEHALSDGRLSVAGTERVYQKAQEGISRELP